MTINLRVAYIPPTKFRINPTYGSRGHVVKRISRWAQWSHLGFQKEIIKKILDLLASVPLAKFQFKSTFGLGDVISRTTRWLPREPSSISGQKDLVILNLIMALMPPTQFDFNLTGGFLFVLLLYVPSQQLWSLRDGQFI